MNSRQMNRNSARRLWIPSLFLALFGLGTWVNSAYADTTTDIIDVLIKYEIAPTPKGMTQFFERIAKGEFGPPSAKEVEEAIAALGSESYVRRVRASRRLMKTLFPPIQRLKKAAEKGDLETQLRIRKLLNTTSSKPHPLAALFKLMETRRIRIAPSLLIKTLERCEDEYLLSAGQDALLATIQRDDLALAKKWIASKNPQRKVIGFFVLGALQKQKAIPELKKWIKDKNPTIRFAALRALVKTTNEIDLEKYVKGEDDGTLVLIYRAALANIRQKHENPKKKNDVARKYSNLTKKYAEVLTRLDSFEKKQQKRLNTRYWIKLKLDASKHPEIVLYRIRWFNGRWSQWFAPGYNDRHPQLKKMRMWGLFNDHQSEVIVATEKKFYRKTEMR